MSETCEPTSQSSAESEMPVHSINTWSICQDSKSELFTCATCQETNEESDAIMERFCIDCIMRCIKRKHTIKNLKGIEPVLCAEHSKIESEYCQTCDKTVCLKCVVSDHSKHEISSLDERAVEVKKKVFDLLTDMEIIEKPLRIQRESINEKILTHCDEQKFLKTRILLDFELIKQKVKEVYEENQQIGKSELSQIDGKIAKIVDQQQNLRDHLSRSNAHIVKEFNSVLEDINLVKKEAKETKAEVFNINSYKMTDYEKIFSNFSELLLTDLKSSACSKSKDQRKDGYQKLLERAQTDSKDNNNLARFQTEGIFGSYFGDTIFWIGLNGQSLELQKGGKLGRTVVFDPENESTLVDLKTSSVRLFTMPRHDDFLKILVLSDDNQEAWTFEPNESQPVLEKIEFTLKDDNNNNIEFTPKPNLLWPYLNPRDSDQLCWSYWEESSKSIRFTHDLSFSVPCDTMPFIRMTSHNVYFLCFVTDQNLLFVNTYLNKYEFIYLHREIKVSSVSTYGQDIVFLWSAESKSVHVYMDNNNEWKPVKKVRWSDCTKTHSVVIDKIPFSLAMSVKSPVGQNEVNVFAVDIK